MIKMYCIFTRETLDKFKGSRGKLASQAGHAYLHAYWDAELRFKSYYGGLGGDYIAEPEKYYNSEKAYKITLVVDTIAELQKLHDKYKPRCGVSLVTDAGLTVFEGPTITCLGIGPIETVDEDISTLKVLT